jgi:hypothetical protein
LNTSCSITLPSSPTNFMVSVPLPGNGNRWRGTGRQGVAADDDRLGPARHQARHVLADDRLAEDHAAQDVADGAVGRLPHFLRLNSFTRASSGVMVAHLTPTPTFLIASAASMVTWSLVASRYSTRGRNIQVDVEIGQDQLVLDELPDDAGHLVAVEFDDGIGRP